jgi:hypothetical protein
MTLSSTESSTHDDEGTLLVVARLEGDGRNDDDIFWGYQCRSCWTCCFLRQQKGGDSFSPCSLSISLWPDNGEISQITSP